MFNLRLCNTTTIRHCFSRFGHMHPCGFDYKYYKSHCCKCISFCCAAAIKCGNACHGPHNNSLYSGSKHTEFHSPRLVKNEAGYPKPGQELIGSNQLWRVNDSPYYRARISYKVLIFTVQGPQYASLIFSVIAEETKLLHLVKFNWYRYMSGNQYSSPLTKLSNSLSSSIDIDIYLVIN